MTSTFTRDRRDASHRPERGSERDRESSPDRSAGGNGGAAVKAAHIITEHIEVGVPAQEAFEAWTSYDRWNEMFKKEWARAQRGSGATVKAGSKIGPSRREWEAEVSQTDPGRRIEWRSRGGIQAKGVTTFHCLDGSLTRVMVEIEYRPSGLIETIGNLLRMPRRRVRKDLRLFKNHVELRDRLAGDRSSKDNKRRESK
jgi:uncharacterized membrane protein